MCEVTEVGSKPFYWLIIHFFSANESYVFQLFVFFRLDLSHGANDLGLPPPPPKPSDMALVELYGILYLAMLSPSQKRIHLWAIHHNEDRKKHIGTTSPSSNRPPCFSLRAELLQAAGPCKVSAIDNILCLHLLHLQHSILYDLEAKTDDYLVPPIQISSACAVATPSFFFTAPISGQKSAGLELHKPTSQELPLFLGDKVESNTFGQTLHPDKIENDTSDKTATLSLPVVECETSGPNLDGATLSVPDWTVDVLKLTSETMTSKKGSRGRIELVCEIVKTTEYDPKWKWITEGCIWDVTVGPRSGRSVGILWTMKLDIKTCLYVIMNTSGDTKLSNREAALFALRRSQSHYPSIPAAGGHAVARLSSKTPHDKLRPKAILLHMIESSMYDQKMNGIRAMFEAINGVYVQALRQTLVAEEQDTKHAVSFIHS